MTETYTFVTTREEADAVEGNAIIIPTLRLPEEVAPLVSSLNALTDEAEQISVWRPFHAFWRLYRLRPRLAIGRARASEKLTHCYRLFEKAGITFMFVLVSFSP